MNVTTDNNDTVLQDNGEEERVDLDELCLESYNLKIPLTCVMGICIVPALLGNSLIIISYVRFRHFRSLAMYKYIVNMAVSDLLLDFAMLLYPLEDMVPELSRYKYFCITKFAAIVLSLGSSVLFLTLISIDRFLAIIKPLSHRVKSQNTRIVWGSISITWIVSILYSALSYVINGLNEYSVYDPRMPCYNTGVAAEGLATWTVMCAAVVLLLDFVLYCFVLRAIVKSNSLHHVKGSAKTKLMILVYGTFTVCWLPFIITEFVYKGYTSADPRTILCLRNLLFLLGVIQACTNWVYYGIWNIHFRKAFRSILCCCRHSGERVVV